ncbi:MAG: hypothetical protein ABFD97_19720 [Syntrophobacter sp.]
MSTSALSSVLSGSTSVSEQLAEMKNSTTSSLLKSISSSSASSSSTSSLTELVYSANTEAITFSAISKSLGSISKAASESGVSDLMDNVRLFALSMKNGGVDTVSILKYLGDAKNLAESDPDTFREVFSNADTASTQTTVNALSEDS